MKLTVTGKITGAWCHHGDANVMQIQNKLNIYSKFILSRNCMNTCDFTDCNHRCEVCDRTWIK